MLAPSELVDRLRIGSAAEVADAATRSHLADGRVVGWYGGAGAVIDAELSDQEVPAALAARYGVDGFWGRWTRTECAAKRSGVPIAMLLRTAGLDAPGDACTIELDGVTVSILGSGL